MATQEIPRSNLLLIKDITPMSRNFNCEVIVLQREGEPAVTRDGDSIFRYLVADKTGTIILSVWGEMGRNIKSGDILRISGVENKLRVGRLILSTPKLCKIRRVGQDTFLFVEKPNMSEVEFNMNTRPGNRMPRHGDNNNNNNSNNRPQHRGYQNTSHPYNNTGRGGRGHRGGYRGGNHNRGGGNNNGNRFHQDLDNPI
ncbi:unnamed protein product [Mucor hiemalis]